MSGSTASGTLEIRPRGPPPLFAARITAIATAVSDSTASAISATEAFSCAVSFATRSSVSASAGSEFTASNAADRRWPPLPIAPVGAALSG